MSKLDDHLDPDRHLWPAEPPEAYQTVLDFFSAENENEAKRNLYKNTACGAWIEFTEQGIQLGSIVEGCDFGTAIYPLNYADNFTSKDIQDRIDAIEKEADATWEWANVLKDITGRRNCNGKTDAERGLDAPDVDFDYRHLNPDGRSS